MNKELLEVEIEWNNKILAPLVEHQSKSLASRIISHPYCMGVVEEYHQNKGRRIMIVGQEPYDFDDYRIPFEMQREQEWSIEYQERQLYDRGPADYNGSPFWNLFRDLNKLGLTPCWANIDNAHLLVDEQTARLSENIEAILHTPFAKDNMTLFQKQVSIADPDAIWFVTGPNYAYTMAMGMQIDAGLELFCKVPTKDNTLVDITEICNCGCPVYWSYHPSYLNRMGIRQETCEKVVGLLDMQEMETYNGKL